MCVRVAVTTLAKSNSLPKSACRVVLNVPVGMLVGDRSAVQLRLRGLLLRMYTVNNHTYNAMRVCDSRTYKALYLSCLGGKESLWETCCGCMGCAAI